MVVKLAIDQRKANSITSGPEKIANESREAELLLSRLRLAGKVRSGRLARHPATRTPRRTKHGPGCARHAVPERSNITRYAASPRQPGSDDSIRVERHACRFLLDSHPQIRMIEGPDRIYDVPSLVASTLGCGVNIAWLLVTLVESFSPKRSLVEAERQW